MAMASYTSTPTASTSSGIWYDWNRTDQTITSSGTDTIWLNWTSTTYTSAADSTSTTGNITIWRSWVDDVEVPACEDEFSRCQRAFEQEIVRDFSLPAAHLQPLAPDPDRDRRWQEVAAARANADERAKALLMDLIGPEQLARFERTGRLWVRGKKHDYIIPKEGFIKRVEKEKIIDMCVHLENKTKFPAVDNVVAMKLALETDEETVLEKANEHHSRDRHELPECACM